MKSRSIWGLLLATLVLGFVSFKGEHNYPKGYFQLPITTAPLLTGTFGELRPNHFHAGIDMKGQKGDPVLAAAEGYVARVKVQASGYGNCVYVAHPNGYTTVYGHLEEFMPEIAKYVKNEQHNLRSFEVDLQPAPNQFPLRRGQRLGALGNTGSSSGPHLHFEIRDSYTEKTINPLLFGLPVTDNIAPRLHQVKVYGLNSQHETLGAQTYDLTKSQSGNYSVSKGDTLYVGADWAGFALKAYDHVNGTSNWNGVYSIDMSEDGMLMHRFEIATFSFDETRYINAHTDYADIAAKRSFFNRCYRLPGNQLSAYPALTNDGVVMLADGRAKRISLVASDVNGNRSEVSFWVKRSAQTTGESKSNYNYFFPYNEDNALENGNMKLYVPRGALYENLYLQYYAVADGSSGVFSEMHHIQDPLTPLQRAFTIGIRPTKPIPYGLENKAFIAYCKNALRPVNCGGHWEGEHLVATARDFGGYCIMVDTVAPTIRPVLAKPTMGRNQNFSFKISDNFATDFDVDKISYEGYIDGQWALFEFDAKTATLRHSFDSELPLGQHQLLLLVTDALGNQRSFEQSFNLVEQAAASRRPTSKRKRK